MRDYFSVIQPELKIASHLSLSGLSSLRHDLTAPEANLQVSGRKYDPSFQVRPHSHLGVRRETIGTSESWVVIKGSVEATLFDLDDKFIRKVALREGDCIVFFNGGHGLQTGNEGAVVYEFKNGPYYGVEADKREI